MDKLKQVIKDENVTVLDANKNRFGNHEKIDKNQLDTKLQNQQKLESIQKDLNNKTFQERCDYIKNIKTTADKCYYEKKFEESSKKYLEAIMGIKLDSENIEEKNIMINEFQIPILLNLSTVFLESKEYDRCYSILYELSKIKQTKNNPKYYYKYAIYYDRLENYEKAIEYIDISLNLDADNKNYQLKRKKFLIKNKQNNDRERNLYKNLFKSNEKENLNKNLENQTIKKKNIFEKIIYYLIFIKIFFQNLFKKLFVWNKKKLK